MNLTLKNNTRNPWFSEFWEKHFNCTTSPNTVKNKKQCTGMINIYWKVKDVL